MPMRNSNIRWIAVTADAGPEDMEAYGVFTSQPAAERFVADYEEEGCRPAYPLVVLEMFGVREGQRVIREERRANDADA